MEVTHVYGPEAVRAWREPDARFPDGRVYAVLLARLQVGGGPCPPLAIGDTIMAQVDEGTNQVTGGYVLHRADAPADFVPA